MNALATWIGTHGLQAYLFALAGLLALACVLGATVRIAARAAHVRYGHVLTPRARLFLYAVAGGIVLIAAMAAFAELAEALDADEELGRFDDVLARALQADLSPSLLGALALLTRLGNVTTLVAVGALVGGVLLFRRRHLLFWTWVIAVAGNGILIRVLKEVFQRVRPLHDHGFLVEQGWSFPSGHASGSMVTYGMLAYLALRSWRPPASWAIAVVLIATLLAVGVSRIFLQVHYFSDVLAGFVSGAAWMTICITACEIVLASRPMPAAAADTTTGSA